MCGVAVGHVYQFVWASCMQSWVNIAIMSERLGVDVWYRGLGEGWSIKDAFDQNRNTYASLGLTWPYSQVHTLIPQVFLSTCTVSLQCLRGQIYWQELKAGALHC